MDSRPLTLLLVLALCGCAEDTASGDAGGELDAGAAADAGGFELTTEPVLPSVTGTCPDFFSGPTVTVSPAGIDPRDMQVWITDAANDLDGPLVFYWHGNGSEPREAEFGLGMPRIDEITALGGMVVAMTHDPGAGDFAWYLTAGSEENDLRVADEVLACAIEQVGIDVTHIHSAGFSAGALHNSQMAIRRASYVASVAIYSGGLIAARRVPTDAPNARFAALLFHGGPSDIVLTSFEDATENYRSYIDRLGHFAVVCNHGNGHRLPPLAGQESVWQFFQDHPYGSSPSPYEAGLPSGFYDACEL